MTQPKELVDLIVAAVEEYDPAARDHFVSDFFDELEKHFCHWCQKMHPECDEREFY